MKKQETSIGWRINYEPRAEGEKRCSVLGDFSKTYRSHEEARSALVAMPTMQGDGRTYWIEGPNSCGHGYQDDTSVTLEDATLCRPCAVALALAEGAEAKDG